LTRLFSKRGAKMTLTKDEILSIKDINTVMYDRKLTETQFDELVLQLNEDAKGFAYGYILQNYQQYINDEAWRNIIKLYVRWQVFEQGYSEVWQILARTSYNQLVDYLIRMNDNFTEQAKQNVTPNRAKNFKVINP
jgi:hypothetical protein